MIDNITIWRTYHKDSIIDEYKLYEDDIHKNFGTHLLYKEKNINKCSKILNEFCTMYYVKENNLYSKYIGFEQYGRRFGEIKIKNENQCQVLFNFDFLKGFDNRKNTVRLDYYQMHNQNIYDLMLTILSKKYGKNSNIYNLCYNGYILYACECYIMSWNNFIKLFDFVSDIIYKIDNYYNANLNVDKYIEIFGNEYQARNIGFITERLISFWIQDNFLQKNILI